MNNELVAAVINRAFASEPVLCLVCGDDAYEVQLCRDDFALYLDWKDRIGDRTSTNRVAEFLALPMDKASGAS